MSQVARKLSLTLTLKPRPFESNSDFEVPYHSVGTNAVRRRVIVTKLKG